MKDSKRGHSDILVEETRKMERQRRALEQEGERRFARVIETLHDDDLEASQGDELEQQSTLQSHPLLDSQRLDGLPPLSKREQREVENAIREQNLQKQLQNNPTLAARLNKGFNPSPGR